MFKSGLAKPVFALALSLDESRAGNGGYLSIGGVPNLGSIGVTRSQFASTPIRILSGDDRFRYYVISIDGVSMLAADSPVPADGPVTRGLFADKSGSIIDMASGFAENGSKVSRARDTPPPATSDTPLTNVYEEYIVDSGTTLSFLPAPIVNKIANMFQPPAILDRSSSFFFVPFNEKHHRSVSRSVEVRFGLIARIC